MAPGTALSTIDRSKRVLLGFAQMAWITLTFTVLSLFFAGIPARYASLAGTANERSLESLGLSTGMYAAVVIVLNLIVLLAHLVIAFIIFTRRASDPMAILVAYALVTNGSMVPLSLMYAPGNAEAMVVGLVRLVVYLGLVSSAFTLYLFPDGRFVPHWTRWLAPFWALVSLPAILFPASALSILRLPLGLLLLVLVVWSGTGLFAQVYRYLHVSSPLQRQQAKWGMFGLAAAVVGPFAYFLPFVVLPMLGDAQVPNLMYQRMGGSFFTMSFVVRLVGTAFFHLVMLVFPLSFAIAILRYRLWDIDILINRALVYALVTGGLALVYFSSVILLQSSFRALTGQGRSVAATVFSTLVIAALFNPFRRQIQSAIDRRFYRRKYDVQKTLEKFGDTLRHEVDLKALSEKMLAVIQESMEPSHVSLWLRKTNNR